MRLLATCLTASLIACAAEPVHEEAARIETRVFGIERVGNSGPYFSGAVEKFRVRVEGEVTDVRWSASAGSVAQEQGEFSGPCRSMIAPS